MPTVTKDFSFIETHVNGIIRWDGHQEVYPAVRGHSRP